MKDDTEWDQYGRGAYEKTLHFGPVFGSDTIIATGSEKQRIGREYKALAVDMESHGVARAAQGSGIAFGALRAIADGHTRVIPPSAAKAVAPDGSIRALSVLGAALRRPSDFGELFRVGRDSAAAHKNLRRSAGHFIPALLRIMDLN